MFLQTTLEKECAEIREGRDRFRFSDVGVGEFDSVPHRRAISWEIKLRVREHQRTTPLIICLF